MAISGGSVIGRRIVLLVLFSVALSIVVLTSVSLWLQLRDGIAAKREAIAAAGYVFASAIADQTAANDRQGILNVLRSIRRIPDVRFVLAIDNDGREIASLGTASLLQSDTVSVDSGWFSPMTRGWFPVATDIIKAGRSTGRLIIVADVSELRRDIARAALIKLLLALTAGSLGVAAAIKLQRRITSPIVSLISAMSHIREVRDYSTKVEHVSDDETGTLVVSFNAMMTEINDRDESLKRLAYFDPLTGLCNRRAFQQHLEQLVTSDRQGSLGAAVMLIDLDEFKAINDTFGHTAGDCLLMDVAARFKAECPEPFLLARLGGDEFAVIADGITSEADAQLAIAPLLAALFKPSDIQGRQVMIGASAGIALVPRDGTTVADLLRRADLALYQAKREGRGRVVFFEPRLDEEIQIRTALAHDLRHAIKEQQLEVHYQAQVDIRTGKFAGFESLLRWKHPVRGYVSPAIFIPTAESNGLICDLGQWILAESCRQAKAWIDQGIFVGQISVNVSVAQIRQDGFERIVANVLRDTGLPPAMLCLEVTESLFAGAAFKRIAEMLKQLKDIGIDLAIDDFGTGYSSLSYLHGLPFDKVKIDRSFVAGADSNKAKQRLLKGVIDLSHALGLATTAEGAETASEVALLQRLGAHLVQGYYFSKPVAAAAAIDAARSMQDLHDSRMRAVFRSAAGA